MDEEPHHHVLLKNEFVEVIRATIPPGESTLFHTHSHDSAGFDLVKSTSTEQFLGKPEGVPSTSPAGEVWADSLPEGRPYTQRVHNVGDGPVDVFDVEFLQQPKQQSSSAAAVVAAENPSVRVYNWVLAPGATSAMHTHKRPYLIVAATSVHLKMTAPEGESFTEEVKPGDFHWVDSEMTHTLTKGHGRRANHRDRTEVERPQQSKRSLWRRQPGSVVRTITLCDCAWMTASEVNDEAWAV